MQTISRESTHLRYVGSQKATHPQALFPRKLLEAILYQNQIVSEEKIRSRINKTRYPTQKRYKEIIDDITSGKCFHGPNNVNIEELDEWCIIGG